jgi:GTPase SAR1 family protein
MTFEGAKTCVSLEEFKQKQKQVEACLADIRQAAHDLGAPEVTTVIDAALSSMHEEKFRLVVVGEFSHGKSTLINALLGDRVLPSSVQPTTAILSVISGNDVPKFKLLYRDNANHLKSARKNSSLWSHLQTPTAIHWSRSRSMNH